MSNEPIYCLFMFIDVVRLLCNVFGGGWGRTGGVWLDICRLALLVR
jgi:hypothetical protein